NQPAFVVTMRGNRKRAGIAEILRLQLVAPVAPLMGAIGIRIQGITLWLRRVPIVPRTDPSGVPRTDPSGVPRTDPSGVPRTDPSGVPRTESRDKERVDQS
ncbi:MAG: hypothetical protein ACXWD8_20050, partial [Mycobacterium sp.]